MFISTFDHVPVRETHQRQIPLHLRPGPRPRLRPPAGQFALLSDLDAILALLLPLGVRVRPAFVRADAEREGREGNEHENPASRTDGQSN